MLVPQRCVIQTAGMKLNNIYSLLQIIGLLVFI